MGREHPLGRRDVIIERLRRGKFSTEGSREEENYVSLAKVDKRTIIDVRVLLKYLSAWIRSIDVG